jgi:hypothetical protein
MLGAKLFFQPQLLSHRVTILPFDATQSELYQDDVIKYTVNITHKMRYSHIVSSTAATQYLAVLKILEVTQHKILLKSFHLNEITLLRGTVLLPFMKD